MKKVLALGEPSNIDKVLSAFEKFAEARRATNAAYASGRGCPDHIQIAWQQARLDADVELKNFIAQTLSEIMGEPMRFHREAAP